MAKMGIEEEEEKKERVVMEIKSEGQDGIRGR